ncbi:P-loop NTPase family protein [Planctomonas psychrotolerans]|uniref:AAA family ATPase n=1 Tax=Planctomonas psychrotolerans TaxID=2528712 RepID=UPI00123C668E|nr:AAA family ATPase [Planctomonas psychrotolerans]
MLRFDDPLPGRPRRILVAGVSGSGKTTLAARIAEAVDAPHTEIDALFHGADWTPRAGFLDDVREMSAAETWTTEWQYGSARPLLAARADMLVWLDVPFFRTTLPRVVLRTLRRRWRNEELWNGNVERPLRTFFSDPEHIVRWAISTRRKYRHAVPALEAAHPDLVIVRLRSRREVELWLAGPLARTSPDPGVQPSARR